jgi:hypothetical protein
MAARHSPPVEVDVELRVQLKVTCSVDERLALP